MKVSNFLIFSLCFASTYSYANDNNGPQFSDYATKVSVGPFAQKLYLTGEQLQATQKWKSFMQKELAAPVNFAGHYRVFISNNGQFLEECGNNGWTCGWIIDKLTGHIVSALPSFNGNTKYHSTTDNGTPSPDAFDATYYPNSTMMLIYGENSPPGENGKIKCANSLYDFKRGVFNKIISTECDIDYGDDPAYGS
ncbi:hypothetical protein SMX26_002760 [Cronobacter universalis]|nr:hypothetical protein [Cronobacter universalis]